MPTEPKTKRTPGAIIRSLWKTCKTLGPDESNSEKTEDDLSERTQSVCMNLSQTLGTTQLLLNFHGGQPVFILKPPSDLVNFPRPRWPIECEVISDSIQHIEWEPPEPEPFYKPSNKESFIPAEDRPGNVVYCSDFATKHLYFTCSRVGGSRGSTNRAKFIVTPPDITLEFESRFESGNLQRAVQVGAFDYELTLRTDMYTEKHTQWFYFRLRNMKAKMLYRFTITNLMKASSLYSLGMKPLLYSERAANEHGVGWHRAGSNIRYYQNCSEDANENSDAGVRLYSLTWTLRFPYDSDTCYLAHCYPYTYSRLQYYLKQIISNPAVASYCEVRTLCQSLAGNAVYIITITSRGTSPEEVRNKKAVVVTARVHPGETNGSWMMEGFLDFLLGDSDDAQVLRDNFVFKVVPMLNPDGVVVGNYRCSLAGRDLNRNYKTLLKDSFPCVWHTRNMVERLMAETEVVLYCDFHGHNRKNNVFMYGCDSNNKLFKLQERVFPLMMSKNASNKFSYRSCRFKVQKSKEGTGRIVMWRLGIKNSYTLEATFGGSTLDDRKGTHFTTGDLKSMGFYFCDTLLDFCDPDQTKVVHCSAEAAALLKMELKKKISKNLDTDGSFSMSDLETSTSGSNSSDSDGLPVHLLHQQRIPEKTHFKKKKKKLKTRKERDRLQPSRVSSTSLRKVLESRRYTECCISPEKMDEVRSQEKPLGGQKGGKNDLKGGCVVSFPTSHPEEVSQGTLEDGQDNDCISAIRQKLKQAYESTSYMTPPSGDEAVGNRQVRCSCPPFTPKVPPSRPPVLMQHYTPPLSSQQGPTFFVAPRRGSCLLFGRIPPSGFIRIAPPDPGTSSISTSSNHRVFKDKQVQWVSGNFPSKGFSTSVSDINRIRRREGILKDSSEVNPSSFSPVMGKTKGLSQHWNPLERK
ncbi:cytosolic carboxypeptidase 2 isoform X2 [Poeciliopsis prolifica]|uniref:cytosolic carboxypeptidase 2 isoform X2 n=1 Tax=Poeciliopsis prolifica TaxID=188132 RepID=UPI0024139A63|nr:cytosolic carboxypeptidase 2 isoform X2 [Poeciliopsis prolifica]